MLKEDNQLLDEVVVVGYGTVKKSDLTGAVSGVSNRQYKNQPVQRVENILQGRTPGVEVTATSGMPGASMKVRVRGTTSINKSSDPLYVIDGIISSSGLDGINPSDIQSDGNTERRFLHCHLRFPMFEWRYPDNHKQGSEEKHRYVRWHR